ncbi:hypothetical protein CWO84_20280 [Methylomonas sp. Kb3]|nr:hypothetical protein CWO84_20280 [Methylomonas sp. Kb3]
MKAIAWLGKTVDCFHVNSLCFATASSAQPHTARRRDFKIIFSASDSAKLEVAVLGTGMFSSAASQDLFKVYKDFSRK